MTKAQADAFAARGLDGIATGSREQEAKPKPSPVALRSRFIKPA